ncbi:MAG TPA: hypothetical protein VGL07_00085 [Buttiauxella sp.]|jgi:hypothetical protein
MKTLEEVRAELLKAMNTTQADPESINKSTEQVLADAIQDYLSVSNEAAAPKGKTIKEKGIALCHQSQGYSANLRPVSLMMKADLNTLSTDQIEALKRLGYTINQGA